MKQSNNLIIYTAIFAVLIGFIIGCGGDDDPQALSTYYLPIEVGTTWQGQQGEAEVVAQETVNTLACIFKDCFRIDVRVVDDYDDDNYAIWLAKNVGPVKMAEIDNWDGEIRSTVVLQKFNSR